MGFQGSEVYGADVAAVAALFADPDAVRARYETAGDRDVEVLECGPDGDGLVIRTRRVVHVDLPGFARKVLKPNNTMMQTDRWGAPAADGARDGTFDIEVHGAPIRVSGTMRIEPAGEGRCRHTVRGDVDVKIPLIGGRLAKWSSGTSEQRLAGELAFHRARLAGA